MPSARTRPPARRAAILGLAAAASSCTAGKPDFSGGGSGDGAATSGGLESLDDDTGATDGGATADGGTERTGYDVGDVVPDLESTAHTGAAWSMRDQAGAMVILVVGHADDGLTLPTMSAAATLTSDAVVVGLVGRDTSGLEADTTAAATIASMTGVPTVLVDDTGSLVDTWAERNPPKTYVIDADQIIAWTRFGLATESELAETLADR